MLSQMEKRDSGNIQLNGISINKYYEDYSKIQELDICIVFDEDVLWLDKTVDENLTIVGKLRGINKSELANRI
jgi:ABC-type multidrug transport system ATPase subunit